MPIKQTTPMAEVAKYLDEKIATAEREVIRRLSAIGERVLNEARTRGNYLDQTGNLRSSVGYVLVQNGRVVLSSGFVSVKPTANEGPDEGMGFARELARKYGQGIVLIVVAGMHYAAYVKHRGYDVIDSAELLADDLVPKMLKQIGFKVQ